MARNYFADPFSTGQDAFDGAYDRTQAMTNQVRRVSAGRALAAGDRQAAMSEFGNAGMTDEVRQIQQDQVDDDDRAAKQAAEAQEQDTAQAKQRADLLIKVAGALKSVPAGQRKSALGQVYPIFQQAGIDTGVFDGLSEDQLSDQSLDLFTGEVESQVKLFNTANGVVAVDPAAAQRGDPNAARLIYEDPLASDYRRAQIDATRARAGASSASAEASRARAAKTRTAPAASSATKGLPPGFVLD